MRTRNRLLSLGALALAGGSIATGVVSTSTALADEAPAPAATTHVEVVVPSPDDAGRLISCSWEGVDVPAPGSGGGLGLVQVRVDADRAVPVGVDGRAGGEGPILVINTEGAEEGAIPLVDGNGPHIVRRAEAATGTGAATAATATAGEPGSPAPAAFQGSISVGVGGGEAPPDVESIDAAEGTPQECAAVRETLSVESATAVAPTPAGEQGTSTTQDTPGD